MAALVDGFAALSEILKGFAEIADPSVTEAAQEAGAVYFVGIMRGKSSPRTRGGRQHMLDTIDYEQKNGETIIGWTLFYGRLVESGHKTVLGYKRKKTSSTGKAYAVTASAAHKRANTSYVRARPHMRPEFEANREQILRQMMAVYEALPDRWL
ncbi:hypothetical protein LJC74_05600 [Eubacteriales bacterium OttesenSCG-928-A19]|nr:hypothetical protein [Eubacteriales bacterium OttesenSCG-928-A19]